MHGILDAQIGLRAKLFRLVDEPLDEKNLLIVSNI